MQITVKTMTHTATGQKFECAVKMSWQTKYYTCRFDHVNCNGAVGPWFPKLSAAYADAVSKGYLILA